MKINKKLNLVVPVETSVGIVHVHSMPISMDLFEQHFMLLSQTFSSIYSEGLHMIGGPRVAMLMLRAKALEYGEETAKEVETTLINEIKRLTNVILPSPDGKGWRTLPYDCEETRGILDKEDLKDIEGYLCFFTLASCLHTRQQLPQILAKAGQLWNFAATSLNVTAYSDSLLISTEEEISQTEANAKISSVPR